MFIYDQCCACRDLEIQRGAEIQWGDMTGIKVLKMLEVKLNIIAHAAAAATARHESTDKVFLQFYLTLRQFFVFALSSVSFIILI